MKKVMLWHSEQYAENSSRGSEIVTSVSAVFSVAKSITRNLHQIEESGIIKALPTILM